MVIHHGIPVFSDQDNENCGEPVDERVEIGPRIKHFFPFQVVTLLKRLGQKCIFKFNFEREHLEAQKSVCENEDEHEEGKVAHILEGRYHFLE